MCALLFHTISCYQQRKKTRLDIDYRHCKSKAGSPQSSSSIRIMLAEAHARGLASVTPSRPRLLTADGTNAST
jgi:hypothetical protein